MTENAVSAYLRTAGKQERETNGGLARQEASLAEWKRSHPEVLQVHEYRDIGVAGTMAMSKRPEGRKLLDSARSGKMTTLLVPGMDRLSRDAIESSRIRNELEALGVDVVDTTASRRRSGARPTTEALRAVTYSRVSTDAQEKNETIKTQTDVLNEYFAQHPEMIRVGDYLDDGVSGTVPFEHRPGGRRLLSDALASKFDCVVVVRPDRIGRDLINMIQTKTRFDLWGIQLIGVREEIGNDLTFGIRALLSQDERKKIRERSLDGLNRAARDGRYIGGVVAYGYRIEGTKPNARLVINDHIVWANWSAADVIRHLYKRVLDDGWSTRMIADELNGLGVPTAYQVAEKGRRMKEQSPIWRPSRVLALLRLRIYKGEQSFGKRAVRHGTGAEVVVGKVPALIDPERWEAAQIAASRNCPIAASDEPIIYLLRGKVRSAQCGVNYCGVGGSKPRFWYRCNGKSAYRGPNAGRCACRDLPGDWLEEIVWNDIERFLLSPGEILGELQRERERASAEGSAHAQHEAERGEVTRLLEDLAKRTTNLARQLIDERISEETYDELMAETRSKEATLKRRLAELTPEPENEELSVDADLLKVLRERLEAGLTRVEQREIVGHLVRQITATNVDRGGRKPELHIRIEYAFGADTVVGIVTDTGCKHQSARN